MLIAGMVYSSADVQALGGGNPDADPAQQANFQKKLADTFFATAENPTSYEVMIAP